MFHSETLARVIHADRVRELERAAETHRLLAEDATIAPTAPVREATSPPRRVVTACATDEAPTHVNGSTGLAA